MEGDLVNTINGLTKEQAMEKAFKIAYEGEATRTNCAQETFHAVSSVLGFRNPQLFRSISAFEGGGAVTTCGSCGAFCGGLVSFSHFFGRTYKQWQEGKSYIKASILGQKLYKKFMEEYGSIICGEIHKKKFGRNFKLMDEENLGINMEELKAFEDMGAHENVCPTVAGLAAIWTVDILWDELPKDTDIENIPSPAEAKKNFKAKN